MTRSLVPPTGWRSRAQTPQKPKDPVIALTEPREGSWTGSSEWGSRYEGAYPSQPDESIEVMRNDRIIGPPRSIGLMLSRSASTATNADVFARITIGAGNVSRSFLCDFRGRLSLVANSIRVEALAYAPEAHQVNNRNYNRGSRTGDRGELARLRCTALLGIDGAESAAPTFTPPYLRVADGFYSQLPPPEHATRIRPIVSYDRDPGVWAPGGYGGEQAINGAWQHSLVLQDFEIVLWGIWSGGEGGNMPSDPGQPLALASYELSNETITRGIDLLPDCRIITIHNYSGRIAMIGATFDLGV